MTHQGDQAVLSVFMLFCRIGGCMMFAPGLASARVSTQIRLLLAVGITLAATPLMYGEISGNLIGEPAADRPLLIFREVVVGTSIGLMGRLFLVGLQFAANTIWSTIGLAGIPGVPIDETESGSSLATLASIAAVAMIMSLGLHVEMLRGIIESYRVIGVGSPIYPEALLADFTTVLAETSLLALRLAAPFIIYGIVVNLTMGLVNRFVPQISAYHASTGLVMLLGFVLMQILWPGWLLQFVGAYDSWLRKGGY